MQTKPVFPCSEKTGGSGCSAQTLTYYWWCEIVGATTSSKKSLEKHSQGFSSATAGEHTTSCQMQPFSDAGRTCSASRKNSPKQSLADTSTRRLQHCLMRSNNSTAKKEQKSSACASTNK